LFFGEKGVVFLRPPSKKEKEKKIALSFHLEETNDRYIGRRKKKEKKKEKKKSLCLFGFSEQVVSRARAERQRAR